MDGVSLPSVLLYVPGDRPDRFAKAVAAAAGVILDLEDAVPAHAKEAARLAVADFISQPQGHAQVWVRVGRVTLEEDLAALRGRSGLAGIVLADAMPETLTRAGEVIPGVPVIALIESAAAVEALVEMAALPNLVTFGLGEVDLLADLGMRRTPGTAHVVDMLRFRLVHAAAAAGLHAPVAPTSLAVRDVDEVRATTSHLRDLGFRSRTAVHPDQCPVVAEVFLPTAEEIDRARCTIAAFERAGGGVAVDDRGGFIDAAVVREARATLGRAPQEGVES